MNDKGQMGVGIIIMIAITIIVGAIFLQAIAQTAGDSTNTVAVANVSLATVVNGTTQYLTDYRALSNVVIYNETGSVIVAAGNYTVTNNVIDPTTGGLSVSILPNASAFYKSAWQVSGTGQPTTYIAESGGRAMANLIVVMFALAILAVIMGPVIKNGLDFK